MSAPFLDTQKKVVATLKRHHFIGKDHGDFFRASKNGHWVKAQVRLGKAEVWAGREQHAEWLGVIRWTADGKVIADVPNCGNPLMAELLQAARAAAKEVPTVKPVTMILTVAHNGKEWYGFGPDCKVPVRVDHPLEVGSKYLLTIVRGVAVEAKKI